MATPLGVVRVIDLCPDAQSPELSVPCSTAPSVAPLPPGPDISDLPFTGTIWFDLLVGVMIGALIVGGLLVYYSRRKRAEVEGE